MWTHTQNTRNTKGRGELCAPINRLWKKPIRNRVNSFLFIFAAITCDIALTQTAVDGVTPTCTNNNAFGSSCSFGCSSGKGLSDNAAITCGGDDQSTTGTWSAAAPTCSGKIYAISK